MATARPTGGAWSSLGLFLLLILLQERSLTDALVTTASYRPRGRRLTEQHRATWRIMPSPPSESLWRAPRVRLESSKTQQGERATPPTDVESSLLDDIGDAKQWQQRDLTTSSTTTSIPDDSTVTHLGLVVGMTLWWYVLSTLQMWQNPSDFLGFPDWTTQTLAAYVTLSQLLVYAVLYKMASATTLRHAQTLVLAATALCIPADALVILFDPTGSRVTTVLAFAGVTMCFGVYLCHYLRKAAYREQQQYDAMDHLTSTNMTHDDPHTDFWKTLETYRPPHNIQATHMALEFARSFVAFTVALTAVRDSLGGPVGEPLLLASLVSIILHTSLEMAITTVFPGVELEEYPGFVATESALYLVHMVAGSYIAHQATFGDTVWDHLTYAWLFGNATAKFLGRMKVLLGKIDFDAKLGLCKF